MDKIKIKDLEVFANHGVFEEEKKLGQKFLVSIWCSHHCLHISAIWQKAEAPMILLF